MLKVATNGTSTLFVHFFFFFHFSPLNACTVDLTVYGCKTGSHVVHIYNYWLITDNRNHRQNYEPCFAPKSDAGFSRQPSLEIELLVSSLHGLHIKNVP